MSAPKQNSEGTSVERMLHSDESGRRMRATRREADHLVVPLISDYERWWQEHEIDLIEDLKQTDERRK